MRVTSRSARVVGLLSIGVLTATTACVEESPAAPTPLENLTIIAPALTVEYGEAIPAITPTYQPYAVAVAGLDCTTTATATSAVGVYPIVCSGATFGNTQISYIDGVVTVTPAPLTITASSGELLPGDADPVVTPSYEGLKAGDTAPATAPTCSTSATAASAVGTYASTCVGASDANYAITYVDGSYQVASARITIAASSASMAQGESLPVVTASYSGWPGGDFSLDTAATCRPAVAVNPPSGTWPTRCSGAADSRYVFNYVDGALTVRPSGFIASLPSAKTTTIAAGSNGVTLPASTIAVEQGTARGFTPWQALTVQTSTGLHAVFCDSVDATNFYGCTGGTGTLATGNAVTSAAAADVKLSTIVGALNPASAVIVADAPAQFRLVPTQVVTNAGQAYVRFLQSAFPPGPTSLTVGYCATSGVYNPGTADCATVRINVLVANPLPFGAVVTTPIGGINQYQTVWVASYGGGTARPGDVVGLQVVPAPGLTPARQSANGIVATVLAARDFMSTVPVPAGAALLNARVHGGDARTNTDPRLATCTVNGGDCWAQHSWGNFIETTIPYVQTSIGTTAVPGGASLTLPSLELAFTATGAPGSTIKTGVSQYRNNVTVNAGIFGDQQAVFHAWPTNYSNTAGVPPLAPITPLLNTLITN
ncbi:MAG: hypothetical protein GX868_03740 [Actinobacteria bacterium]|nr:hypothetical protein [Actinomycetota bacterium]